MWVVVLLPSSRRGPVAVANRAKPNMALLQRWRMVVLLLPSSPAPVVLANQGMPNMASRSAAGAAAVEAVAAVGK